MREAGLTVEETAICADLIRKINNYLEQRFRLEPLLSLLTGIEKIRVSEQIVSLINAVLVLEDQLAEYQKRCTHTRVILRNTQHGKSLTCSICGKRMKYIPKRPRRR